MDHIHNDDLWRHEIKMAAIVGVFHKFCMDKYGKKNFEWSYLGQERRYWALTHRYGYRTVKRMHKSDFWVIFKTSLEWCSFAYTITIPVCKSSILSSLAKIWSLKNFLPIIIRTKLTKVPQLKRPSLFRDITNCHCGYGPYLMVKPFDLLK